jgi:hypothetical protein
MPAKKAAAAKPAPAPAPAPEPEYEVRFRCCLFFSLCLTSAGGAQDASEDDGGWETVTDERKVRYEKSKAKKGMLASLFPSMSSPYRALIPVCLCVCSGGG